MACVTLKRSMLDHDGSPSAGTAKRRRYHHHHCGSRSPTQIGAAAAASGTPASTLTFVPPPAQPGNSFSGCHGNKEHAGGGGDFPVSRLPPELLSQRLAAEVKRLQRRRHLAHHGGGVGSLASAPGSPSAALRLQVHRGKSPESDAEMSSSSSSSSASSSAAAAAASAAQTLASLSAAAASSAPRSPQQPVQPGMAQGVEPSLFTLSQVQAIADKLLAEREAELRAEFQALLSAKLQEQYDAFLRFNHDQIYRMHRGAPMSYVS